MKFEYVYSHHNGVAEWKRRGQYDWVTDVFEAPSITLKSKCTAAIRSHVSNEFQGEGWGIDVKIDQDLRNTVFAMKDDLAFQLQTGNMSRAPYDLLKLQFLHQAKKIEAAALALPTKFGANKIGSNIANAERLCRELDIFDRVITVPILVVAFE